MKLHSLFPFFFILFSVESIGKKFDEFGHSASHFELSAAVQGRWYLHLSQCYCKKIITKKAVTKKDVKNYYYF